MKIERQIIHDQLSFLMSDKLNNNVMLEKTVNSILALKILFKNLDDIILEKKLIPKKLINIIYKDEIDIKYIKKTDKNFQPEYYPAVCIKYKAKYFLYMGSTRVAFLAKEKELIESFVIIVDDSIIINMFDSFLPLENILNNRICLVTLNVMSHRTPEENLGLYYLKQLLEFNGYDVLYIDGWLEKLADDELIKKIKSFNPLFVGISGCAANTRQIFEFRNHFKDLPLIVGGYGGSFSYEELLNNGVDLVSIGEGEYNLVQIAEYFRKGLEVSKINFVAYKDDEGNICLNDYKTKVDFYDSPLLDRKYLNLIIKNKSAIDVYSSKGCSGRCIFCSINEFYKKKGWKNRDNDNVFAEIKEIYEKGGRIFKFVDDSFIDGFRDAEWCKTFKNKINSIVGNDFRFRVSIRTDKVTDEIIKTLKECGLFAVSCGVENFSNSLLKRMRKAENLNTIEKALSIFKKYEIYVQAGFILFDDETTFEEIETNLEYLKKYNWIIIKGIFSEMYATKGTDFYEKIYNSGGRDFKYGNLTYTIKNLKSSYVYNALRQWHLYHQELYDKLIDPISAPKALVDSGYQEFYSLYLSLFNIEIDFFEKVVFRVKNNLDIEDFVDEFYGSNKQALLNISEKCDGLYKKYDFVYTGEKNQFI